MKKEIHRKVFNKLESLPDNERKLALKALELSSRTNSSSVSEKLFQDINKIISFDGED